MRLLAHAALVALLLALPGRAARGEGGGGGGPGMGGGGGRRGGGDAPTGVFDTRVPAHEVDVVAGRPTGTSAVVSVRTTTDRDGCVQWTRRGESTARRTAVRRFPAGVAVEVALEGLAPDAAYAVRVLLRGPEGPSLAPAASLTVHTQRPAGSPFTFTVQACSHLDQGTESAVYVRTLSNVAAEAPDFHVDLGDTFMTDKRRDDFREALPQYEAQRWYLSLPQVPLFLVLGNHDGEVGWRDRGLGDDMPHWSLARRKALFPNPEPDGFYSGNDVPDARGGLRQDWYAWTWGDALFVALDPFWPTTDRRGDSEDGWGWTLGETQYRWLARTLQGSRAKYRVVMIHHLVGGIGPQARGGAEAASLFEWGGRSAAGADEFGAKRPGWPAPIHDLLRRAGPTLVLHGHDHFYARQEKDGVVYQMVPQPGNPGHGDVTRMAQEYGYRSGEFLSSPGHLRVRIAPDAATVEYVRSAPGGAEANGAVVRSYSVPAATPPQPAAAR